ncbi:hypothetical protein QJS04_geneDACA004804 [Acorus gramineus]|uniref:CWZF3/5/7 THD domain-containing protein n=1 Tax=Acorus gramineus TaxID=55184 RepID=A0AAV9BWM4_ACOGR|nr:hypothetical protein QJS04_geneDACA004804 [Acorus gramineus]
MLDWLPGMNSCSVSEEETTKALNALYQIPLPESQTTIHGTSGITLADGGNPDQLQPSLHPMPVVAKKKSGSKDSLIAPSQNQLPNSVKKSQPVSLKCRSLNDVNQHPPYSITSSKDASQQSSKSNDLFFGKRGHKSKDKHKSLGHFSDGGNITGSSKQSKLKSKWETDQESMRASKKIRLDGLHHTDEDWHSENGSTGKVVLNSCSSLQAKVNGENIQKFNEKSSVKGFIEGESRDDSLPAGKKMRDQSQMTSMTSNGAIEVSEVDLAARKRKVKEFKSDQVYPGTFLGNGHLPDDMRFEKVEIKEIESRKEKKSRLSKTDHKEAKANKAASRKDKKGRVNKISLSDSRGLFLGGTGAEKRDCAEKEPQMEKDQNNAVSQRTMDGLDPLRRDLGYPPPLTAATSSSSKVSGSHKNKGYFQEVRGSPVESVSSSPLRISNTDKITSKRNLFVKDESTMDFSIVGSPKRLSDGEAEGGSDQSKTSKAKAASIFLRETMNGDGEAAVLGSFRGALHYQDMDTNQISSTKAREEVHLQACSGTYGIHFPSEFPNVNVENGGGKTSGQITQHEHDGNKNWLSEEKRDSYYHVNESSQLKSKSNSLCSKDRHKSVKPDVESGRVKASDTFGGHEDNYFSKNANGFRCGSDIESRGCFPYHEEMREKSSNIPVKDQKNYLGKKISVGNTSSEGGKDGLPIVGTHEDSLQGSPLLNKQYSNFTCAKDLKNVPDNLHLVSIHGDENSAKNLLLDRAGEAELAPGRGKSQPIAHSGDKQERQNQGSRVTPAPSNGSKSEVFPNCLVNGDASRLSKQKRYPDNQSGSHQGSLKQPMPNGVCSRDIDAPSPVRKDGGHSAATVVLKEARDLKHSANRLKSRGLEHESTGLYFQAALKFLYVASLLESSSAENGRHGETQSIQMYSETARLCNFCAHEYEKCKEMASAALAYKCTEVAYMKVVYSKQTSVSKDCHELQATMIMAPPGESPSSSASDVDNLNHLSASDKAARAKGTAPHVGGNIVFAARNRPNFQRLFSFTQDVNSAMEASRKSYIAFAAASSNFGEAQYGLEGKTSVRSVLDFNFHDVEGLLRLVRLAMEAVSH